MFGKRCLIQTDSPELARKIKYMLERQRIPYEEKVKDGMSAEQLMSRLLSGGEERAGSGQVRHISLYIHKCDVRQAEELVRAVKRNPDFTIEQIAGEVGCNARARLGNDLLPKSQAFRSQVGT